MPAAPSKDLLTQKAGPLPVWGWAGGALGLVWAYSKYKANQAAQGNGTTTTTNAAGESTAAAPQFVIENNEPWGGPSSVSVPVTVNPPAPVPVTTPPGTTPTPPTTLQGGNPPRSPVGPVPVGGVTHPGGSAAAKYVVYKVQRGDSLSSIAAKYHTSAAALWSFNTGPSSPRDPASKATLLRRGKDLLYSGEEIYIPQ